MTKVRSFLNDQQSWLVFLLIVVCVRSSFADQYRVPSGSMLPTIAIGDHLLVNKMAYDLQIPLTDISVLKVDEPVRGDIVVFESPIDPNVNLVKRLIGLPGDHIAILNGFVWINGTPLVRGPGLATGQGELRYEESYGTRQVTIQRIPDLARAEQREFVVPEGKYFFMGDNRDNSSDSRAWGFASRGHLKGRVLRVLYSVSLGENFLPVVELKRTGQSFL